MNQALELNRPLATVYYMKEDLRQLWNWEDDKTAAEWHLKSWIEMAKNSGIEMFEKFAKTLEKHFEGILAYFDFDSLSTVLLKAPTTRSRQCGERLTDTGTWIFSNSR